MENRFACGAPRVIGGQNERVFVGFGQTDSLREGLFHLCGYSHAVEIGKDPYGFERFARGSVFELKRIVVRKFVILCGGEFDGSDLSLFIGFDEGDADFGEGGSLVVFGEAAILAVFFQVRAVACRIGDLPRRIDGRFIIEIHAVDSHIAVFVDLTEQALRKFIFVLHCGCACHVDVATVLDRHIVDGAATEGSELGLHNAAGIVEREVQMSAERNDLIIFGKNIGDITRDPHIGQRGAGLSAERASVDGVVDHGVREDQHVGVGICLGDFGKRFVKPSFGCFRKGDVGIGDGEERQDVIAANHTVAVALRGKDILVHVCEEIILSEHSVENIGLNFRFRTPFDVMVADGENHGCYLGVENGFINPFIVVHLLIFAAVAACIDQVARNKDGVNATFLELCERTYEIVFVTFVRVISDMNIADCRKGERDLIFIEDFRAIFGGDIICIVFHKNILSADQAVLEK